MEQPYILPILYCQHHACWCPGDFMSQGTSRYGINQISQNILSLASDELKGKDSLHTDKTIVRLSYLYNGKPFTWKYGL